MSSSGRERPRLPVLFWWLILAWVVITVVALILGIPNEEDDLTARAQEALRGQAVTVEFDGRDALLRGEVDGSAGLDLAVATVRQVRGVRRVFTNDVKIVDPVPSTSEPPVEATPPDLTIKFGADQVVISGTVPNQADADAISDAAEARWGPERFVNQLVVGPNTTGAPWLFAVVRTIDGVDDLTSGAIEFGTAGVLVTGSVATGDVRQAIEETLLGALRGVTPVENRLEVVAMASPSLEAELQEDGTLRLRGVMPNQAAIDAMVDSAAAVYGSGNVVDEMTVVLGVAEPAYLDSLRAIFGAATGLRPWRINVADDRATLSGLAEDEAALALAADRFDTAFAAAELQLTQELEVDFVSIATVLTELLEGSATFETGSATLSADAGSLLDEAIVILQANITAVLTVEGHTDDVGSEEANLSLSEARAQAVVDYLVNGGVDASRLTSIGYGETRPVADNSTEEGRSQNRRIQFVVGEGGTR